MKTKNIYIVRHGQTDYNKKKMVQGRGVDASLNDTGREQADRFYQAYKTVSFDKIYTSSLRRTVESVQGFISDGISYEQLPGLDEISWGTQEGLPYDPVRHKEYLNGLEAWKSGDLDYRVAGGESPNEVAARQKVAVDHIMAQENEETILISTHGRAMRFLVCWMMGQPLNAAEAYEHSNLCVYRLTYDGQSAEILLNNNTDHLVSL